MDEQNIITAARSWIGTAFRHQGRQKREGLNRGGVDCLGLLIGVAKECGLRHKGGLLAEADARDYGHIPDGTQLYAALTHYLQPVSYESVQAGDVLLFTMDRNPQHLGLVGDYQGGTKRWSLIHAYAPARAVVEHRLDREWQARIAAQFRFKMTS